MKAGLLPFDGQIPGGGKIFQKGFYLGRMSDFRKAMRIISKEEHPVYLLPMLTYCCRMWTGTKAGRKTRLEIGFPQNP